MPDQSYINNVYRALKENLDGFNKTPEQFERAIQDKAYASRVHRALSETLDGFSRTEDEFYSLINIPYNPKGSREKLYNAISSKYDIGTFDDFNRKMDVPESRRKLYDNVSNDFDLGDFTTFESKISQQKQPYETNLVSPQNKEAYLPTVLTEKGKTDFQYGENPQDIGFRKVQASKPAPVTGKSITIEQSSPKKWEQDSQDFTRHLGNKVLEGAGGIANAITDLVFAAGKTLPINDDYVKSGQLQKDYRGEPSHNVRQIFRETYGSEIDPEAEKELNEGFVTGALGGLASSVPAIIASVPTGGASLFLQGYDSGLQSVQAQPNAHLIDEDTKTIYAGTIGAVLAAMEKWGLDRIVKGTGIANTIANKILSKAAAKSGGKITGNLLEEAIDENIKGLANRFSKVGMRAIDGFLTEAVTGGAQEAATIGAEKLLNEQTGKSIFDTKDSSSWQSFISRVGRAAGQEGIGGGVIGSGASVINSLVKSKLTERQATIDKIDQSLNNPDLQEASREVLLQQRIKIQGDMNSQIALEAEQQSKYTSEEKQQAIEYNEAIEKLGTTLSDPGVPEELKSQLQTEYDNTVQQLQDLDIKVSERSLPAESSGTIQNEPSTTDSASFEQGTDIPEVENTISHAGGEISFDELGNMAHEVKQLEVSDQPGLQADEDLFELSVLSDTSEQDNGSTNTDLSNENTINSKPEAKENVESIWDQIFDKSDVSHVLSYLDGLKIQTSGAQSKILPVVELYNSGIEIIKTAIKTGNSIRNAVKLAKDYLRENGAKEDEIKGFEDKIGAGIEIEKEKQPSLKQIIQANTDKRSKSKVVLSELQALKKQIKDKYAGFKEGRKQGKTEGLEQQKEKSNQSISILKSKHTGALNELKEKAVTLADINQSMRDEITALLDRAEMNGAFSGDTKGKTLANALKKIVAAGDSPKRLLRAIDYVASVAENAEYDSDLQAANSSKSKIRKGLKSKAFPKSATSSDILKGFLRIKPEQVDDLKEYNEIAERIQKNQKGVSVGRDGVLSNESFEIANREIEQYVDEQLTKQYQKTKDRFLEDFQDLVDAGVIDTDSMSLSQMKELVKAIDKGDSAVDDLLNRENTETYAQKRNALKSLLDSKYIELDDYLKQQRTPVGDGTIDGTLSPDQKAVISALKEIDISQLDLKQMVKLNDVLNNIIYNEDFSGSGDMAVLSDVQSGIKELDSKVNESGIELGSIGNAFIQGMASINLMPEFIFKSSKIAAEAQRLTGISGVFDGHARARVEQNKAMKQYMDLKKTMLKGSDSAENRYRRGVYARIIQHFGGLGGEQMAEFARVKELIRQTAEKLSNSNEEDFPEQVREGKVVQKVYDELLEGTNSVAEVRERMEKIYPDNIKLVEFWVQRFDGIVDKLSDQTEIYDNKTFEQVANYTPTKMKAFNGGSLTDAKSEKDPFEVSFFSKKIDDTPTSTKITRTKSKNLPKNAVLDLDFDALQSRKYYESLYDIETSKSIAKVRMTLKEPKVAELFGGVKNLKVIQESIRSSVMLQKGNMPLPDKFERVLIKASNVLQAKGARLALGSISQLPKQYLSVAVNTLHNLGSDAPLYFKALRIGNNLPLFEKFNIGLRGTTMAGYAKDVDLNLIESIKFKDKADEAIEQVNDASKKVSELSLKALTSSDVAVARTSWLSYYMQDLTRQGVSIESIDWKNEHEKPNEEAAAYAEQMVSRNQNANDGSSMGNFYKKSGNAYANIFKSLFLPFSTFSVNQRMRMTNDVQKLLYGGEKAEAARSLTGTLVEQSLFNALKVYIIGQLTTAGANALLSAFDFDDDKKEDSHLHDKFASNTFSDLFFSGIGTLPKLLMEKASNSFYSLVSGDRKTKLFYQYDPVKYGQPDLGPYGIYATPFVKAYQAAEMFPYIDGTTQKVTKGGTESRHKEKEVDMQPNETDLARAIFMINTLGLIGLSDADLLTINQKAQQQFKLHMGKEYGGKYNLTIYDTEVDPGKKKRHK